MVQVQAARRERLAVLIINGVAAIGVLATLIPEPFPRFVAAGAVIVFLVMSTIVQLRSIDSAHARADAAVAAQGARDKMAAARHADVIRKIETQDYRGAIELIQSDVSTIVQRQTPPSPNDDPDVSLSFALPNQFVLQNYGGHATDVTIAPTTIDEYVSAVWDGQTIRTPEQSMLFAIVDIDYTRSAEMKPRFTFFGGPHEGATAETFFKALIKRRRIDHLGVGGEASHLVESGASPEQVYARFQQTWDLENAPIDLEMTVLCTGRMSRRRWRTTETLHYEPNTRIAYVKHSRPTEIIT
jgi:hypothetical protein